MRCPACDRTSINLVSMIDMFSKTLRFVLPREDVAFNVDDRIVKSSYYMSGNKLFVAKDGGIIRAARIDRRYRCQRHRRLS